MGIWSYTKCIITPAGFPPEISLEDEHRCAKCKGYKPERTHHCRVCDRCVLRMDHHCIFVANCIGANNHKHYTLYCLYACLASGFSLLCHAIFVLTNYKEVSTLMLVCIGCNIYAVQVSFWMCSSNMWLISKNNTIIESLSRENKYDRGSIRDNVEEVMGKMGWQWVLPIE